MKTEGETKKEDKSAAMRASAAASGISSQKPQADAGEKPDKASRLFSIRHTTPYQHYRRAGVVLTKTFMEIELNCSQLEVLKADPWVEIEKE